MENESDDANYTIKINVMGKCSWQGWPWNVTSFSTVSFYKRTTHEPSHTTLVSCPFCVGKIMIYVYADYHKLRKKLNWLSQRPSPTTTRPLFRPWLSVFSVMSSERHELGGGGHRLHLYLTVTCLVTAQGSVNTQKISANCFSNWKPLFVYKWQHWKTRKIDIKRYNYQQNIKP